MSSFPEQVQKAYEIAKAARQRAHAPYSKFLVGACLKLKGDDSEELFIPGCNVENVSYGATVCAERNVFGSMVAKLGKRDCDYIVVVTNTEPATMPCALCLQVMAEFCESDFKVYMANLKGIERVTTFRELLPLPFTEFKS